MNFRSTLRTIAFLFLLAVAQTLHAQTITNVLPPLGAHGDFIQIFGSGFAPGNHRPNTLSVDFNGTVSTTSTNAVVSDGEIDITNVPLGATSGRIRALFNGTIQVFSPSNFVVINTNAYVTNFTPLGGGGGSTVKLTGVHMIGVTNVTFNGVRAQSVVGLTANSITVVAPSTVTSGPLQTISKFGVSHDFNTKSNVFYAATNFFVAPAITSFMPASGRPGTNIIITGINFTASAGVMFGSVAATDITISNNTTIRVAVPTNASTGKITVLPPAIPDSLASAISIGNFSMLPTIYSFSPTSGTAGTVVTVNGAGLNEKSPNPTVTIGGGTVTGFITISPNTLSFNVPATATSGLIVITTTNGSISSTQNFFLPGGIISFTPTNGAAGTVVQITGKNFTNASAVSFNGIAATTFSVVNNTTISATAPVGVTSGTISVTTPFGAIVSTNLFYVAPTITNFTPNHGAPSATITITGTSFTNASAVSFNGTPAASFVVINNTNLSAVVPAGATTGKITVTAPGGTGQSATDFTIDAADLGVSVSDVPDPVFIGSNLLYTITVTNSSTVSALNVLLQERFPTNAALISATTSQGSLNTGVYPIIGSLGTINGSGSVIVALTVIPHASGLITNTATVTTDSADPNTANNTSAIVTTVWPLPFLSITNLMSNGLLRVSWPAPLSNFTLQFTTNIVPNLTWNNDPAAKVISGTNVSVIETNIGTAKFFRLTN